MNSVYKIAIIGCGRIAKKHLEVVHTNKNLDLISVCDINEEKAKKTAKSMNVKYYTNYIKMLQNEKIDIVSILTPSGLHAKHTIDAANYKKHVIVEKPMALTLDDADKMIEACDINGVKLFVVKQNRYNKPVQKLRAAIVNNRFGKIVLATVRVRWCRTQKYYDMDDWRGTWKYDGGVLANQASHHIDLLEWMVGEVESVFAKSNTSLVEIETEDTAVATLKFRNGALGIIEATTAARPKDLEGSLSILGEKGSVEIGGFAVNSVKHWQFSDSTKEDIESFNQNPPDIYGFGHKKYYENVIASLQNNTKALVDGLEGRKSLELITAIYESIETGKEVFLQFKPLKCRLGL